MAIRSFIYSMDGGGVEAVIKDYARFKHICEDEMERIMEEAGDIILDVTADFVPIDTGALLESGFSTVVENSQGKIQVDVGFGGDAAPVTPTRNAPEGIVFYAWVVHESPDHPGFKFLEKGIEASRNEVDAFIQQEVKEIMETQRPKPKRGRRK